jgi:tRNA-Thr(GGU) m(6)t(6)A37 methyltransferase TsaA
MKEIRLTPIGFVMSKTTEQVDENWGQVVSRIQLGPEFAGALKGLEGFSHAIIVTYLHQASYDKDKHLQRRPQGLADMPKVGIFSQRAKDRPNPIGVTSIEIIKVADDYVEIRGLDAINDTPVLDIKPYYSHFDRVDKPRMPEWVDVLMKNYF